MHIGVFMRKKEWNTVLPLKRQNVQLAKIMQSVLRNSIEYSLFAKCDWAHNRHTKNKVINK